MIIDGTTYNDDTPQSVISILRQYLREGQNKRLCLRYGDVKTGKDWGDPRMCGSVGRSTGPIKIPLLIKTRRSMGGEGLLENHIVDITVAGDPCANLYQHPKYHGRPAWVPTCRQGKRR